MLIAQWKTKIWQRAICKRGEGGDRKDGVGGWRDERGREEVGGGRVGGRVWESEGVRGETESMGWEDEGMKEVGRR